MSYKTEQENFWAGDFGEEYIARNLGPKLLAANINLFSKALSVARDINSCIEFGANIGMNLRALKILYPDMDLSAIEINETASKILLEVVDEDKIHNESILNFQVSNKKYDLVLIKGVLIHINPDELHSVYKKLAEASSKYILLVEYYNPNPIAVVYRGHKDKLFKRDFAGELLASNDQLQLVDYGFIYRNDPKFPMDDLSWFLIQKK